MKNFWDGMELWEKLLVLLTGAMTCVLLAGALKILYTKLRVKKYSDRADARRAHLQNMRDSRNVIDLKSEDVPFGIRAIEAGIEIEGVVISRPPTPIRGSYSYNHSQTTLVASDSESTKSRGQGPPSPRSYGSPPMKQVGRSVSMVYQPSPYLPLPPSAHQGSPRTPSVRSSVSSVTSAATPPLTRVPSREKLRGVRRSAPEPSTAPTGTSSDGATRSPSTSIPDTLAKLEGRAPAPTVDPKTSGSRTLKNSNRTPSPPEGPVPATLPSVDENEISENSSREGDLSLINEHRLSHAAEVGQLRPRRSRHSRMLSGPLAESPVASDGVYALDIAMPSGMPGIEGLQYPAPAVMVGPSARPERPRSVSDPENLPMFDGPWLARSGDGEKEKRDFSGSLGLDEKPRPAMPEPKPPLDDLSNSGRLALLLDTKPEPRPEPKPDSEPEPKPESTPEPKPKQKPKPKKLQKKRGRDGSNRGSAADPDLEAPR